MKTSPSSRLSLSRNVAFLLAFSLSVPVVLAQTQNNWTGGNGTGLNWNLDGNWQAKKIPVNPTYFAAFNSGTAAGIDVADGSTTNRMTLDGNTDINLNLAASPSSTLALAGLLRVGNTNAGSAHLALSGSGAFTGTSFQIGSAATSPGGNTMTFSGSTTVQITGANAVNYVGRFGYDNHLTIENGNTNTLSTLYVGFEAGGGNNGATIAGESTRLEISDGGSNRGIKIGNRTAGTNYADGSSGNYLEILSGATVMVSSNSTSSNNISIGDIGAAHGNYLTIDGARATLELGKGTPTVGGTTVLIGDTAQKNLGGNYIEVKNGGKMISLEGHTGGIIVNGYTASGENAGANYLSVGAGGTIEIGGDILISNALLVLEDSGKLSSANITVSGTGRFEVAGDGLSTTGITTINAGATLAVGADDAITATTLTLNSTVNLTSGGILELKLFDGAADQIVFDENAEFFVASGAVLRLLLGEGAPQLGDSWTLFGGETDTIDAIFSHILPALEEGLEWNMNGFNREGGWRVEVIPEPSAYVMIGLATVMLCGLRRSRNLGRLIHGLIMN